VRFVLACVLVVALSSPALAMTRPEQKLKRFTDRVRADYGLVHLTKQRALVHAARLRSRWMAHHDTLRHSSTHPACNYWGEIIGVGLRAWEVFRAFMRSSAHRAIILDPRYRHIGYGVVQDRHGRLWVTGVFCG
jgi:uncharacterized protein YkwD